MQILTLLDLSFDLDSLDPGEMKMDGEKFFDAKKIEQGALSIKSNRPYTRAPYSRAEQRRRDLI